MAFTHKLKLLVVCSKNQWRSPTAAKIYQYDPRIEIRSAGTSSEAQHLVSNKDIDWADIILCMEQKHREHIQRNFNPSQLPPIIVANIEDSYQFMDPELIELLKLEIEELIDKKLEI